MATIPTIESILLQIVSCLGLDELQTKTKAKFRSRQMSLAKHQEMCEEVFIDICRALKLDTQAESDMAWQLIVTASFHAELERSTWTFGADQRQVLWYLLGYTFMPQLGRNVAFWELGGPLDNGMPGGYFWFLPQVREKDGEQVLSLPVQSVLEWLFDLTGLSMNQMAGCLGGGYNDSKGSEEDTPEGIESNLYNWRVGRLPRAKTIDVLFRDECRIPFNGCFAPGEGLSIKAQLDECRNFIQRKGLTPDRLRHEIPMTAPGAIEAVLAGTVPEELQTLFVQFLAARYAKPSMQAIRQRLQIARAIQDGYGRLVAILCPKIDESCPDPGRNKVLQLLRLFEFSYNLTIQAKQECNTQEEENAWFESNLPHWDVNEVFFSILPSLNTHGRNPAKMVGQKLSKRFLAIQEGEELEDLIGWDEASGGRIINRNILRWQDEEAFGKNCLKIHQQLRSGSPWRTLQAMDDFEVLNSALNDKMLPDRVRQLVLDRLKETARTQDLEARAILVELSWHLDEKRKERNKKCSLIVEDLLSKLEENPCFPMYRAQFFQYKAKHYLSRNEFDLATDFFRRALDACEDRNCGTLTGEIARDLLGLSVASQPLIPNNHEKYYRYALFSGLFDGNDPSNVCLENASVWAFEYFWRDLYKPYPGVDRIKPRSEEQTNDILGQLLRLCDESNWEGVGQWVKKNSKLKGNRLPDVRGDTFVFRFLKIIYTVRENSVPHVGLLPHEQQVRFNAWMENCLKASKLLVQLWPQSINLSDFKGQTPLMIAANNGDHLMVEVLLMAGADSNIQDYMGRSALTAAISARSVECTKIILESRVDTSLMTKDGNSILHTAVRSGHPKIVEIIKSINPSLVQQPNDDGLTPKQLLKCIQDSLDEFSALMTTERRKTGSVQDFEIIEKLFNF